MDLIVDCSGKGVRLVIDNCELNEPSARGDELNLLLDRLLSENNLELSQIKRVLVALGPGSFTGIRVGIAFCEGLCFSGKRTLHGIPTSQLTTPYAKLIDSIPPSRIQKANYLTNPYMKNATQTD
jgi:tRNA threonylcarbamoyladenosine biosynthesis protein TsaB